jgi:glycosyltransferase involved in cell wall biosynthesis
MSVNGEARVVIIMPVYNEARHLPAVLASIARQTFDRARMRLIAVDGASTDESAAIVARWLDEQCFDGTVLHNPRRKIPISLNLALRQVCADDIVLRLDAHTVLGETYVAQAVSALENAGPDVGCIGAAQRPMAGRSFRDQLVRALYCNPMGLGGADFRTGNSVRTVDSAYLGVWPARLVTRLGGFNEAMEANEDAELSARVRGMGLRIIRVPLPCEFIINRGIGATIRQWNRYGYWRAKMLRRHPGAVRLRHILPPLAALLAVGLAVSPLRILLLPAFAAYAAAVFWGRLPGESLAVTFATMLFFPALQFAFAVGMLRGLFSEGVPPWPRSEAAQMRS